MLYKNLKLFIEYNDIQLTRGPVNDKYLAIFCMSENDDTLTMVNNIGFNNNIVKYYSVPNTLAPFRTYMDSTYKSSIQQNKMIPIKVNYDEFNRIKDRHFYIDMNLYLNTVIDKWNVRIFNSKKYKTLFEDFNNKISRNLNSNTEKVLFYSVDLDKEYNNKLLNKKILPIYLTILKNFRTADSVIPFDKIIFAPYSNKNNIKNYYLIYDKDKKINLSKIRSIITKYKSEDEDSPETEEYNEVIDSVTEDDLNSIKNFSENVSLWYTGAIISSLNCEDEILTKKLD